MPLEQRAEDTFTIENFILGFSQVTFQPRLLDGSLGTAVAMGILAGQELQKEVELLEMPNGESGTETTALELVSKLKPQFELELFNFRADLAQFIFGSGSLTPITADSARVVLNESIQIPTDSVIASQVFTPLINGSIDDTAANLTLNASTVTEVISGDGSGTTDGDYKLGFKVFALADVNNGTTLEFTETVTATGALVRTFTVQAGEPTGALEAQLAVGLGTTSGELDLFQVVPVGNQLNITYTPSFDLEEDFDAVDPDMLLDPLLGRIRFPNLDTAAVPDGTSALRVGQVVELDYLYNQKSGNDLKPFTQGGGSFNGVAVIKHLPDVGSNFIWDNIDATIRIDDNALTFGSDDFVRGTVVLVINDAGGTQRFGDLFIASQTEAAA